MLPLFLGAPENCVYNRHISNTDVDKTPLQIVRSDESMKITCKNDYRRHRASRKCMNGTFNIPYGQVSEKIKLQGGFDENQFFSGFYLHMYQDSESKV